MYLGVDLGTSSIKVSIANNDGIILGSKRSTYKVIIPQEGYSEQDPNDWYKGLIDCLKQLQKEYDLNLVDGISFSGQMHGLVMLDENDNLIDNAILWNDNRAIDECDYLNNKIGKEKVLELTGNIAYPGFTGPKLMWVKEHCFDKYKNIKKIMLPKDYLVFKLTNVHCTDVSDASGTLLFDVKNRKWSKEMIEICNLDLSYLPKVFESSDCVGFVNQKASAETGLNTKCKVIVGGGDQAVGAIGTGTIDSKKAFISLGTSGVVFSPNQEFRLTKTGAIHSFCDSNNNYFLMGVTLSAAGSLEWYQNNLFKDLSVAELVDEIDEEMTNVYFLPYLSGERSPIGDPKAKGVLFGLSTNTKRKDITKAIVEGINFSLLDCLISMEELGIHINEARVIGGGSKSIKWMQMLSDTLGISLSNISTSEGGALGAIILAIAGCNKDKTIAELCNSLIQNEVTYNPNKEKHVVYLKKYQMYKAIYNANKNLFISL